MNHHFSMFQNTQIFLLMLISFFLHVCVFADVFVKNINLENNQTNIQSKNLSKNSTKIELIDISILPFFCLMAHLIWTIVPIVILDQCCIRNTKSLFKIILKLFICTFPLLLCSELSISFLSHLMDLKNDLLFISIKWLIFISTIFICFWTGILSDKNKWRGIHGGQIAPQQHSPLYLFQN